MDSERKNHKLPTIPRFATPDQLRNSRKAIEDFMKATGSNEDMIKLNPRIRKIDAKLANPR